uniref:S1 motif domain-containing protein n=1 Tax=Eptatretus burgeri TaxID=7764 RepID=A0A8C4PXD0_EPTBU
MSCIDSVYKRGGVLNLRISSVCNLLAVLLCLDSSVDVLVHFLQLHRKKDVEVAKNSKKNKKMKVSADKSARVGMLQNISEGMLLLGSIKEVRQYEIVVSLPGGLSGYVDVENLNQLLLVDLYPVGLAVRCRVLGVFETMHGGRSIKLSLKPQDVNSGLSATILHPGMVGGLPQLVISALLNTVLTNTTRRLLTGILRKWEGETQTGRELAIGQPVFCVVEAVKAGGRMVQLSAELPVLLRALATVNQGWTLYTLLPGLVVEASVTKVTRNAVMLEFLSSFEGIVDLMHLTSTTGPSVGDQVKACVLYVHPTKRLVGLSLHPKLLRSAPSIPSPAAPDLGTIQHDCTVTSYLAGTGVFLTLSNGTKAFAKVRFSFHDVSVEPKTIFIVGSKHSCRLLDISPIDQMVIVSLKRRYRLYVTHQWLALLRGMFVHLGDYLRGFVPRIHLADVPLSHPERRFNPDEIISCKVLNLDHKRCAAVLTCKPTLLASQLPPVCSREAAVPGTVAHGCVICVRDFCIVVQLLGDVRGVIPRWQLGLKPHKKPSDAYYLGQVWFDFVCISLYLYLCVSVCVSVISFPFMFGYLFFMRIFLCWATLRKWSLWSNIRIVYPRPLLAPEVKPKELQLGSRTSGRVKLLKPCHALITLPGGLVGRLHVSELFNSVEPGSFPIQSLKVGQKITTTVIGNWKSKKYGLLTHPCCSPMIIEFKQQKAVWVRLTPTVRGKVEQLLLDLRPKVCLDLHCFFGVKENNNHRLALFTCPSHSHAQLLGFHKPIPGSLTLAFVQEVNPASGLVLELPQCKVGKVGLTEMADCYSDQPLAGFAPKDVLLCCILAKDENGIFWNLGSRMCILGSLSWTLKGRLSYRNLSQYSVNEAAIFKKHLPLGRLVTVKVIRWVRLESGNACTSPITGRRMTRKEQLREERKLACREREMADPTQVPRFVDDFERLLLGSPNSSLLWVQFMAFHLQSSEVEQARAVAERALRTISFREEQEKLNVWVALLNLENMYGSEENLNSVFQRALRYNDALKVYHRLVQIYTHSDKPQKAEALFETMVRKFRQEKTIWVNFGMLQMQRGQMESVRSLLQRALKCLPDRDHIEIIVKFAQLHFRSGGAAHGNSLLENVVTNFPRRTDVWSIYLDMLIKYTTPEQARLLFERAINMDAPSKQMKFFFKRYMDFERSHGDEQKVQYVRQQALSYVEKQSNLPKDG